MSALRDILEKMYVEDELLDQLDDEQKQILFIKMREEQIRRWNQREAELEKQERTNAPKKKDSRRIQWLKGRDGEVWVWVMGDHPNDPSIDDIIEDEARQKARRLAEVELANDRNITSGAVGPYPPQSLHPSASAREEQLKQELRNMRLGGTSSSSFEESSKASSSDDGYRKPSNTPREDDYRREEEQKSNGSAPYYAQLRRSPPDGIELEDGRRLYLRPSVEDLENTVREQFNGSPFEKQSDLLQQKPSNVRHQPSRGSPTKNAKARDRREKTPKLASDERRSRTGSGIGSNFVQRFLDEHDPKRRASRDKSPVNSTSPLRNRNDSGSTSKTASPASTPRQNSLETGPEMDKKAGSFLVGSFNSRQARSPTKSLREEVVNSPEPQKEPKTKPKQRDEVKDAKPKPRRFLDNKGCIPRLRRSSDDNYYASDENTPVRDESPSKEGLKKEVVAAATRSNGDKLRVNGNVHELTGSGEKRLENGPPPPVPQKPAFLAKKPKASIEENGDDQFVQSIRSYTPGHNPTTTFTPQQVTSPSSGLQQGVTPRPPEEPVLKTTPTKATREPEGSASSSSSKESSDTVSPEMLRLRQAQQRLEELLPTQDELEKRQSLILEKLMEEHQRLKEEAEKEAERERIAYEDQKRRSREAEAQIRAIAQKAREQHEKNIRTSTTLLPMLHKTNTDDLKSQSIRDAVKNMPRPPKPKDRAEIIEWFKKKEQPQGVAVDPWTKRPFVWFHGILSRAEADGILANQPPGAFIVRISERIWGYTISYVVAGPDLKHFLVERIPEGYQFLGTNQVVHKTLQDLVDYHETKPITSKGQECLLYPVGQKDPNNPDYSYLFDQLPVSNGTYNSSSSLSSRFFQSPPSLFVNR